MITFNYAAIALLVAGYLLMLRAVGWVERGRQRLAADRPAALRVQDFTTQTGYGADRASKKAGHNVDVDLAIYGWTSNILKGETDDELSLSTENLIQKRKASSPEADNVIVLDSHRKSA